MKKIIALVLCLVMSLCALTSCGANGKSLEEVKEAGKLVVATSPDFEPFEFLDGTNVVGIEVEIMQIICDKLGVEFELEQIAFDFVLPGVQAGNFDCGMSGITVTPEREKVSIIYSLVDPNPPVRTPNEISSSVFK